LEVWVFVPARRFVIPQRGIERTLLAVKIAVAELEIEHACFSPHTLPFQLCIYDDAHDEDLSRPSALCENQ
jgi:hypothetical protein